jgi:hypothetical protein
MVLIASAFILNYAITNEKLAASLVALIADWQLTQMQFMLVVNLFFLVLGCFLDGSVMMLVFVPLLMPAVRALGIDATPTPDGIVIEGRGDRADVFSGGAVLPRGCCTPVDGCGPQALPTSASRCSPRTSSSCRRRSAETPDPLAGNRQLGHQDIARQ